MGWEAVARDRYLYRRGSTFYVRRRVPKELVPVLGREHVAKSLRTADYREANRRAILQAAEIQEQFDVFLGKSAPPATNEVRSLDNLTTRQIEEIVFSWFRRETNRIDAASEQSSMDGFDEVEEAEAADDPQVEARELNQSLARLERGTEEVIEHELRPVVAQICRDAGIACRTPISRGIASRLPPEIVCDRHGSKYRIFRDLVRRGQSELLRHWIAQATERTYDVRACLKSACVTASA